MPYQLKTKEVVVGGETLVVSQASNMMEVERSVLITDAGADPKEYEEGARGNYLKYAEALLYPSLVACTTGNMPTLEEFTQQIPSTESDAWVKVAQELNPNWFQFIELEEEDVEKKD